MIDESMKGLKDEMLKGWIPVSLLNWISLWTVPSNQPILYQSFKAFYQSDNWL